MKVTHRILAVPIAILLGCPLTAALAQPAPPARGGKATTGVVKSIREAPAAPAAGAAKGSASTASAVAAAAPPQAAPASDAPGTTPGATTSRDGRRWVFRVRLDDGSYRGFRQDNPDELRVGDRVTVEQDRLRRAQKAAPGGK